MFKKKSKGGDAAPEKKKKKITKKLLIIAVAAVLALGGAGGYLLLGSGSSEPSEPEPGAVVVLDPVTINLADGHYLKVALGLQATAEVAEEPDGSKALDLAIDHFSDLKMTQLASSEDRRKAKHDLAEKVEKAYEGEIMDIYFREFVMQ